MYAHSSSSGVLESLPLVGPSAGRSPRWEWRGLLIDSARTCFAPSTLHRIIELAARYGFNRLHWHLTDDAGWRLRIPEYPLLTERGAYLPRNSFEHYGNVSREVVEACVVDQDSRWRNGFYTDDEIISSVDHARELGITVVPEVDLPGHMLAAIRCYPELGRPKGVPLPKWARPDAKPPVALLPAQNDLLWPTDEAREFVEAIIDRVVYLFDSPVVHIGGDECAYHQWETDPGIGMWLDRRGLTSVPEIQTWFMDIAVRRLAKHGRRVAVWDESCEIGITPDALITAWESEPGIARAVASPNRYVFADARWLYLNKVDPTAMPAQRGMEPGMTCADILTAQWPEAYSDRCVGVQANVWSEFVLDEADLLHMLFPRLLAVAERMWNPAATAGPLTAAELDDALRRIDTEYEVLSSLLSPASSLP